MIYRRDPHLPFICSCSMWEIWKQQSTSHSMYLYSIESQHTLPPNFWTKTLLKCPLSRSVTNSDRDLPKWGLSVEEPSGLRSLVDRHWDHSVESNYEDLRRICYCSYGHVWRDIQRGRPHSVGMLRFKTGRPSKTPLPPSLLSWRLVTLTKLENTSQKRISNEYN
jgi:hypothetical protein